MSYSPNYFSNPRYERNVTWGYGCWFRLKDHDEDTFHQGWVLPDSQCPNLLNEGLRGYGVFKDTSDTEIFPDGRVWCTYEDAYCPEPSTRETINLCVERCPTGSNAIHCEEPPKQNSCQTQTSHPIDLMQGHKLRLEEVYQYNINLGISFDFLYNNLGNSTLGPYGRRPHFTDATYISKSYKPIWRVSGALPLRPSPQYAELEASEILTKYSGDMRRYWRHTYQDYLILKNDGTKEWIRPSGFNVVFGSNSALNDPEILIQPLHSRVYGYWAYKLKQPNEPSRVFDHDGRLRRVVFDNGQYHQVHYSGITISHIEHWAGAELLGRLDFEYSQQNNQPYLTRVTDDKGRVARFKWEHEATLHHANQFLLTQITYPDQDNSFDTEQQNNAARTFEYNDPDLPVSITQIYDVDSVAQLPSGKRLYAEFQYDTQGRAIYSSLANGVDAVQVDYLDDNTRAVTNALGKVATYRFNTTNGVKRLASITGEPTSTCAESNVSYEYDAQGNRILKTQNGIKTRYRYDTTGLEIERVEAEGTPEQRVIKTEWNTQLRKPSKVIYPDRVLIFLYESGMLKTRTEIPR